MKKKKLEKKKRTTVRERDWATHHEQAFSHDLVKHRRALSKLSETAMAAGTAALPSQFTPNATLISHSKKWAFVQTDAAAGTDACDLICLIDERLHEGEESLLASGDRVLVEFEGDDAFVRGVAARRTTLSRPAGDHDRIARQVIAANIDLIVVVAAAAQPPFRPGLVDRFLIAAEIGGVEPVLCLNKADLAPEEPSELQIYRDLGMRVCVTSCVDGQGLDALRGMISGRFSVFAGHSGVGKSSLLNALDPALRVHTQEVSGQTLRGRHTTTAGRLYELGENARVIDTPGIRSLGLWRVTPAESAYYFPELAEASMDCKYRNCTHTHEPDCAVKTAVSAGRIKQGRYDSYCRVRASLESDNNITPGRMKTTE
jgi:ribosome biogenesis GTPase